ncbi:MAG TPA: hypothetical protein VHM24_11060, partial [Gemmatimonadaceae bacterium]|nr:hypothetical protein [Gemmatimonadaceae bacterium]
MSSGANFSCGLTLDGTAWCWGLNDRGQVGDGTTTTRLVPTKVLSNVKFTTIAAGAAHTCALTQDGVPYCWGANGTGQSGGGVIGTNQLAPAAVIGGYRFVSIA